MIELIQSHPTTGKYSIRLQPTPNNKCLVELFF